MRRVTCATAQMQYLVHGALVTLETMPVRSVQRAAIHDTNRRQSGTALFLVRGLVAHASHSLSNSVLALEAKAARTGGTNASSTVTKSLAVFTFYDDRAGS